MSLGLVPKVLNAVDVVFLIGEEFGGVEPFVMFDSYEETVVPIGVPVSVGIEPEHGSNAYPGVPSAFWGGPTGPVAPVRKGSGAFQRNSALPPSIERRSLHRFAEWRGTLQIRRRWSNAQPCAVQRLPMR